MRIEHYERESPYFALDGEPTVLIGGTKEDNIFQIPDLPDHLDLLQQVGGNYVRCTMSSRDEGDIWPFRFDDVAGAYDLNQWDERYFERLDRLLAATDERGIVVQIELWATYDFYLDFWLSNPWNPRNNVNYSPEESGLPEEFPHRAWTKINPFFETVPRLADNSRIREFQEAFARRVMEVALQYEHVLYCIDNETNADPEWTYFWNSFIRGLAEEKSKAILVTEMWDNWDPSDGEVPGAFRQSEDDHPYIHRSNAKVTIQDLKAFDFIDISNHNGQKGHAHWKTLRWVREKVDVQSVKRPVTCVKMYGGDREFAGTRRHAEERFWRNLFGGVASVRFHRPPSGLGLSELAQRHLRAARSLLDRFPLWEATHDQAPLAAAGENEAYCCRVGGTLLVLVLATDASVHVNLAGEHATALTQLDFDAAEWIECELMTNERIVLPSTTRVPAVFALTVEQ